jgi:DNA ligase (NAD+)
LTENRIDRIAELTEIRDTASAAYYSGEAIMSDDDFDVVLAELTGLGVEETTGHGYVPEGKVAHKRRMLSLAKVRTEAEVLRFIERVNAEQYSIEYKYDGLAISLVYEAPTKGASPELIRAVTRGNGDHGEDVTYAVRLMAEAGALPLTLTTTADVELRGEVMLSHTAFAKLNAALDGKYSNERNAAAGILRRQSGDEARALSLVIHDEGTMFDGELAKMGFTTSVDHMQMIKPSSFDAKNTAARIMAAIAAVDAGRHGLDFGTDGAVIKVVGRETRNRLGESSSAPQWAIAFKFASEVKQTVLRDIQWQLGRTGKLTPVAIFDTTVLAGANVAQATLHNFKFIEDMGLAIGDIIDVTRSGEVIPYVMGRSASNTKLGTPIAPLTEWAARDGQTYPVERDDINLRVVGYLDPVTVIVYGIQTLGILGVSTALVTKLVDAGTVKTLPDMLAVTAKDVIGLDRQAQKSADAAVKAIREGLGGATVGKWFATIGLHGMGRTTGRVLETRFGSLDAIAKATEGEVQGLDGFGTITTRDFLAARPRIQALADELRDGHGYIPGAAAVVETVESQFTGLQVVVTGTFPTLSRSQAEAAVTRLGGTVRGSVSKTTDLVVAGESAGSKLAKAEAAGVRVMGAEEFEAIVAAS